MINSESTPLTRLIARSLVVALSAAFLLRSQTIFTEAVPVDFIRAKIDYEQPNPVTLEINRALDQPMNPFLNEETPENVSNDEYVSGNFVIGSSADDENQIEENSEVGHLVENRLIASTRPTDEKGADSSLRFIKKDGSNNAYDQEDEEDAFATSNALMMEQSETTTVSSLDDYKSQKTSILTTVTRLTITRQPTHSYLHRMFPFSNYIEKVRFFVDSYRSTIVGSCIIAIGVIIALILANDEDDENDNNAILQPRKRRRAGSQKAFVPAKKKISDECHPSYTF